MKKTLVMGVSSNKNRYAARAVKRLLDFGHEVIAFGKESGNLYGIPIIREFDTIVDVHTLTLYLNRHHQQQYYDSIIALKPQRVIFNPGAYNKDFEILLDNAGIRYERACTLTLLNLGIY